MLRADCFLSRTEQGSATWRSDASTTDARGRCAEIGGMALGSLSTHVSCLDQISMDLVADLLPHVRPVAVAAPGVGGDEYLARLGVVTTTFQRIYVFVDLDIATRRVVHWNLTTNPTAEWTVQQFRNGLPLDTGFRFLVHDRDSVFAFCRRRRARFDVAAR